MEIKKFNEGKGIQFFEKLDALKYLVENIEYVIKTKSYDEMLEANAWEALRDIINSNQEIFNKDYLDKLLEKAKNN